MQGIGANGWLGKCDGGRRDGGIPARIIPAEHTATTDDLFARVAFIQGGRSLRDEAFGCWSSRTPPAPQIPMTQTVSQVPFASQPRAGSPVLRV